MICKWCGAKIDLKKRKCPSCGREVPPVSDCGGFYDIVPRNYRQAPAAAAVPAAAPVQQPKAAEQPPLRQAQPVRPAAPKKHTVAIPLLSALLGLSLLLGLISVLQTVSLKSELKQIEALCVRNGSSLQEQARSGEALDRRLRRIEQELFETEQPPTETAAPPTESTELPTQTTELPVQTTELPAQTTTVSTEPAEPPTEATQSTEQTEPRSSDETETPLWEQDLRFVVRLDARGQLAAQESSVPAEVQRTSDGVEAKLDGALLWQANLREKADNLPGGRTFIFVYDLQTEQLGEYRDADFVWKYLDPATGGWEPLRGGAQEENGGQPPAGEGTEPPLILQEDSLKNGVSAVTIRNDWFRTHLQSGPLQIGCEFTRSNREGGTFTLMFEIEADGAPMQ